MNEKAVLRRRRRQGGHAMIEFALVGSFMVPVFLGMAMTGINLTRGIQIVQLTRDVAHMYAKTVDFSMVENQNLVARLATGTNFVVSPPNTGDGVVILSQVLKVHNSDCPLGCNNLGLHVFRNRIVIGNRTIRTSDLGNPTSTPLANGDFSDYLNDVGARVPNGAWLDAVLPMQAGDLAYVVEGYLKAPNVGFSTGLDGVYSRTIF